MICENCGRDFEPKESVHEKLCQDCYEYLEVILMVGERLKSPPSP